MKKLIGLALGLSLCAWGTQTPTGLGPFDNTFEGLYRVRMECKEANPSKDCQEINREAVLVIMNINNQLAVSIGYPEVHVPRYLFLATGMKDYGSYLTGNTDLSPPVGNRTGFPAEFELELAHSERGIEIGGWIRDPRGLNDVRVTGLQSYSAGPLFWDEPSSEIPLTAFVGRFAVVTSDRRWILTIRKSITTNEMTPFLAEAIDIGDLDGNIPGTGVKIRFTSVQFHKDYGVLGLATTTSIPGAFVKWTLALEKNDFEGLNLRGYLMSSYGRGAKLRIQRIP